jgi:DNA polymerase
MTDNDLFNPDPELFDPRFVGPKGSNSPHLYIIGEAPGHNEAEQGLPFVGKAGMVLDRAIVESKIDSSKIRFFNAIPYRPFEWVEGKKENRTPSSDEIEKYSVFLKKDIDKTKPKVLLLTGASAMNVFGISMAVGTARLSKFKWKDISTLVTYHPSFVLRKSGFGIVSSGTSESFETLVGDLKRAWIGDQETVQTNLFKVIDIAEE